MQFEIPFNSQFAAITIDPLSIAPELSELIDLGKGRYLVVNPSFEIEPWWRTQLGEIKSNRISENSLLVIIVVSSDCSDGSIDRDMVRSARSVLYSLFLQGIYFSDGGTVLCGGRTNQSVSIRSVQDLDPYFRPRESVTALLDDAVIKTCQPLADGLESIYLAEKDFRRIKRGFHSYLDGVKANHEETRLRHFVRSTEAIIRPKIGKTRNQFRYRGQLFAGRSNQMMDLLEGLYDLRSCAEHMNDIRDLYPNLSEREIDKKTAIGSFQSEVIANHVYRRLCEDSHLRMNFRSESSIEAFWLKSEQDQMKLWGKPIDLEAKVKERFNPDL